MATRRRARTRRWRLWIDSYAYVGTKDEPKPAPEVPAVNAPVAAADKNLLRLRDEVAPSAPSVSPPPAKVVATAKPAPSAFGLNSGTASTGSIGTGPSGASGARGSYELGGGKAAPKTKGDDLEKAAIAYEDSADQLRADADARTKAQLKEQSIAQTLTEARAAATAGDVGREVQLYAQALEAGATGKSRLEALQHACEGLERLGQTNRADAYCDALLNEFPSSVASRQLSARRGAVQGASPVGASKAAERVSPTAVDSAAESK